MRLLRRGGSYILGAVALLAGAAALAVHAPPAHAATGAPTQPCIPNASAPGVLPTLPVIDANVTKRFTLYVSQGAAKASGVTYCYTLNPNDTRAYVEAPTIHIRQGGTFVMTLRNLIPSPSPNPSTGPTAVPTPRSAIIRTADNCAWLPDDGPLPAAVPGYDGYFNHTRVPPQVDPPWMLANDTNFHTHGFHVSPYVDNVYKSLVWAPDKNTCNFTFTVRASQPPGSYWYHAHLHGLSDAQVGGGLGGVIIVDPPNTPPVNETVLLIKNYPFSQDGTRAPAPLQGTAMASMDGMDAHSPMLGRPAPAAHDASLAARGAAPQSSASPQPYSAFAPPPWRSGIAYAPDSSYCPKPPTSAATVFDPMGVNGALIPAMVNGAPMPAQRGPSMTQLINTVHRYSIVNALSDSFVNIQTVTDSGARVDLRVVARDGVPVNWNFDTSRVDPTLPSTIVVPNVFVPPSSRVDIDVVMNRGPITIVSAAGTESQRSAANYPYCIGDLGFGTQPQREILRVTPFVGPVTRGARLLAAAAPMRQQHVLHTAAARLVAEDLPRVTKSRAVTFSMYTDPDPNPSASPNSFVTNYNVTQTGLYNGANPPPGTQPLPFTERPFWLAPGATPPNPEYPYVPWIVVHKNDVEEWSLINATGEIHAFHIHQLTFVALDSPFEATNPFQQVFLDSIALPAGKSIDPKGTKFPRIAPSVTKVLIDFRNVDPGVFVFHCHMLFHEDHGMMGVVEVLPALAGKGAVHHG